MARRALPSLLMAMALAVLSAIPAAAQVRPDATVLRVGVVAGYNQAYVSARAEPFRRYLADALGTDVQLIAATDLEALVAAQIGGTVHAAFLSATVFAGASAACNGCIEPLVVPVGPGGQPGYHAVLVAASGGVVRTLRDLPGRRLAVSAGDSIAGRLLPLSLFADEGIALDTVTLVDRLGPADALAALVAGEADAALAWSTLTGDAADGYDGGTLAQLVAAGLLDMSQVALIWTSPLIPYGPLAVRADLAEGLKTALRDAMLDLDGNPDALAAIDREFGNGYEAATPEMFAPLTAIAAGG